MHDLEDVLGDAGFWTALVIAGVGTWVVWLRFRRAEWEPGAAAIAAVAVLAGLRTELHLPGAVLAGAGMLAVGEYLTREQSLVARTVALMPGAVVLGASFPEGWPFWMRAATAVVATLGGVLAVDADVRAPRLVPPLLAIGALGVYACVPDTEAPKVLLGALVGVAAIGLEPRLRHRCCWSAVVGLFAWVAVAGGVGRDGSVVGGLACLGVVVLVPLVPRWGTTRWTTIGALVVQAALVAFVSRRAGFEDSATSALVLAAPAFVVAWLALVVVLRAWRPR